MTVITLVLLRVQCVCECVRACVLFNTMTYVDQFSVFPPMTYLGHIDILATRRHTVLPSDPGGIDRFRYGQLQL
jgi:hypothetical protein